MERDHLEDEVMEVGEDLRRWTSETAVGRLVHGAAPATLVEGVHLELVGGGEGGEEGIIGVAVVTGGEVVLVDVLLRVSRR